MKDKSKINGEALKFRRIGKDEWDADLVCCDCNLYHHMHIIKEKNELYMYGYRDDYETNLRRKKK